MVAARMSRVIVALASPLFACAALAIWAAPEQAVQRLGLETVRTTGLSVVRADIGGLFAGMSILCTAAAWTRSRPWIFAALAVLVSIVAGRSVGWISNRGIGSDVLEFAVEIGLVAALLGVARGSPPAVATVSQGASRRRLWRVWR